MKTKLRILFITIFLIISIFPISKVEVLALGTCTSSQFYLSNINQDKSQTSLGCYADLSSAKSAMSTYSTSYNDMIIQHEVSLSPMKIVAAQRAIASSYPLRRSDNSTDNSVLLTVWQYVNGTTFSGYSTYMQAYRDLFYYVTDSFDPVSGDGTAYIQINGFRGYVHIKSIDIIPLIYIEKGWTITLGGNTYEERIKGSTTEEKPFTLVPHINKYNVYTNTSYPDASGTVSNIREISHSTVSTYSGNYFSDYTYGKAPDWLPNGTYYSADSIHFYYDMGLTVPVMDGDSIGEYFNYYQYLPLRSKSNLEASNFDTYVNALGYNAVPTSYDSLASNQSMLVNQGSSFKSGESQYGINALLIYAIAMHESGIGRSRLAIDYKNLYGWGAYDSNVSAAKIFDSISSSVLEYMGMHIRGYLSIEDFRFFSTSLGSKDSGIATKYASDPYWANKVAGWAYRIDRYSGFKDYNVFEIGMITNGTTYSTKSEPNDSSLTLYSYTVSDKIRNYTFLVNDQVSISGTNWYEVNSTMPITDSGTAIYYSNTNDKTNSANIIPYNWQNGRVYLKYSNFKLVATGLDYQYIPYTYNEMWANQDANLSATLSNVSGTNTFSLSGTIWQDGVSTFSASDVTYKLNLVDTNGINQKTIDLTTSTTNTSSITSSYGQGWYTYNYSGFGSNTIDFSSLSLADGVYRLSVVANVKDKYIPITYSNYLSDINFSPFTFIGPESNPVRYTIKNISGYGIVLEVDSQDYQLVDINFENFRFFNTVNSSQNIELSTQDGYAYSFTSSNISVVTVNNDTSNNIGVLNSISTGEATITINLVNSSDSSEITVAHVYVVVDIPLSDFTLNTNSYSLTAINQTQQISASFSPSNSNHTGLKYYSLNPSIARVDANGLITALDNGYTTIKVISEDGTIVKDVKVNVALVANTISLNTSTINVSNIKDGNLYALFDANNALTQTVTWSSSNSNIVKVTNGLIEAVGKGSATVTATLRSGVSASATINSLIMGDANGSNTVTLTDLVLVRQHLLGITSIDSNNLSSIDINSDSNISLTDLVRIRRILLGME